jgi:hypothetical protein
MNYKHPDQSLRAGVVESPDEWKGGKVFDIKKEVDAGVFGQFKSRAFCYGGWYVMKLPTNEM